MPTTTISPERLAALAVHPYLTRSRYAIYKYLAENGPATIETLNGVFLESLKIHCVSPRVYELQRQGLVKKVGQTPKPGSKRNAMLYLWDVVDAEPVRLTRAKAASGCGKGHRHIPAKELVDALVLAAKTNDASLLHYYEEVTRRLEEWDHKRPRKVRKSQDFVDAV